MTKADIDRIEALLAKATQGEWALASYYTGSGPDEICRGMIVVDGDYPTGIISENDPPLADTLSYDLDLIVALYNAAPALIAAARENERLREVINCAQAIMEDVPDINPSNYDHEQVCALNTASNHAWSILEAALEGDK